MAEQDTQSPFVWGRAGAKMTPEQVARDRAIAEALLKSGVDTSPVGHWTQGAARLANAIAGSFRRGMADDAEAAGQAEYQKQFDDIIGSLMGGSDVAYAAPDAGMAPVSSVGTAPAYATEAAPVPPARIGETTADPNAPVDMSWLQYANQGATRSQPLSQDLTKALSFLPELGVQMEVFSGGQPEKGSWPMNVNRVGSTRHDNGNAADVYFSKDGRRLDWANPDDLPIYQDIVRRAKQAGVTGFGAGEGYMRPGSMHIGFGAPGVWGAGGRGANAPDWLRAAYEGGGAPAIASAAPSASAAIARMAGATPPTKPDMAYASQQPVVVASADPAYDVAMSLAQPQAKPQIPQAMRNAVPQEKPYDLILDPMVTPGMLDARPQTKPIMVDGVPIDPAMLQATPRDRPLDLILDPMVTPGMLDARPQAKPLIDPAMRSAVPPQKPASYADANAPYQGEQGAPFTPQVTAATPDATAAVAASLAGQSQPMPATQPVEVLPPSPQAQPITPQQYAQTYQRPAAAAPQAQRQPSMAQLMQLASNPWAPEGSRAIINSLIQQQMQQQDPMRALQMEKARLDIEQAKNPRPIEVGGVLLDPRTYQPIYDSRQARVPDSVLALDERAKRAGLQPGTPEYQKFMVGGAQGDQESFFGNPIAVKNPDGSVSYGQIGNRGSFKPIELPPGASFAPPTKQVDVGTEVLTQDQAGNIIARTPKDLSGAERAKVMGKSEGEAAASLPGDLATAEQTVGQINQLLDSKGLESVVGPLDQYRPSWALGEAGRDALARLNQLKGGAFLQAYGMLKGGGQITEVEGKKAEQAVARMDRALSENDFRKALEDFRDAVSSGMGKLRQKAGISSPKVPSNVVPTNIPGVTIKRID